jgi:hypothetical protein
MAKCFFCAINYPGSWANGTLTALFFSHITKRIGDYKICVDQGFPPAGDATGILVGPIPERSTRQLHHSVRDHLICLSNVYTSLCRQVNGECKDYRGHSLAAKNACQQTRTRGGWCWSVLFLYTIFKLSLLGLIRSQRYLTPNTKI